MRLQEEHNRKLESLPLAQWYGWKAPPPTWTAFNRQLWTALAEKVNRDHYERIRAKRRANINRAREVWIQQRKQRKQLRLHLFPSAEVRDL